MESEERCKTVSAADKSTEPVQEAGITPGFHPKDETMNNLGADATVQGGNDMF